MVADIYYLQQFDIREKDNTVFYCFILVYGYTYLLSLTILYPSTCWTLVLTDAEARGMRDATEGAPPEHAIYAPRRPLPPRGAAPHTPAPATPQAPPLTSPNMPPHPSHLSLHAFIINIHSAIVVITSRNILGSRQWICWKKYTVLCSSCLG